jgi:Ran GTPase-activating protein (RanGAP) involved in mRNA processing and transport
LESLDLGGNKRLRMEVYELIAVKYIANLYSNLTTLRLAGNLIGDEAGILIAQKLLYKTPLRVLDLTQNSLSNAFTVAMSDVLLQDKCLTCLYLSWNNIRWQGMVHLAEGMKNNTNIQLLALSLNPIGNLHTTNKSL